MNPSSRTGGDASLKPPAWPAPASQAASPSPALAPSAQGEAPASTHEGVNLALARLQQSRQQLQAAWAPASPAAGQAGGSSPSAWQRALQASPLLGLLGPALQQAWSAQPWAAGLQDLGASAREGLGPWVRRHPLASVALAAVAGAALVACRPWRLLRPAALGASLRHQVGGWAKQALRGLGDAPAQMALGALTAWLLNAQRPASGATSGTASASPSTSPSPASERTSP